MGQVVTLTDALEAYFRARPLTWIDGKQLAEVAGAYAWRSRVSDMRKRGLVIENRVTTYRTKGGSTFKASEYRYVPSAPEQPSSEPQGHNVNRRTTELDQRAQLDDRKRCLTNALLPPRKCRTIPHGSDQRLVPHTLPNESIP